MDRRSFMKAILAAGIAPYVSTAAGVLMPIRQRILWLWGDGIHDDTAALQGLFNGEFVRNVGSVIATTRWTGVENEIFLSQGKFLTTSTLYLPSKACIESCYFTSRIDRAPIFTLGEEPKPISERDQMSINL